MTDMEKHSQFGGSVASRILHCPGSVRLSEGIVRQGSKYAAEGTRAHALAEHCLKNGVHDLAELVGATLTMTLGEEPFSQEMCDAVQVFIDTVRDEMNESEDAQLYVEQSFDLSVTTAAPGEVYGRCDAIVYTPSRKRMVAYDYKHGAGVSVSAEDNAQAKFYASGALLAHQDWPIQDIEVVIVQPRAFDVATNGAVRCWTFDPFGVFDFVAEYEIAIGLAKSDSAPLSPGAWCKFCPAAPNCVAVEMQFMEAAKLDFAGVAEIEPKKLPKADSLSAERLGKILAAAEPLEGWLEQLRSYAMGLLEQGVPVPGWKLVDRQARRKWAEDGQKIATYLAVVHGLDDETLFARKIAGIAEVERALATRYADKIERKAAVDDLSLSYTIKESSGRTMVQASSKREAVNAAAADFASVKL